MKENGILNILPQEISRVLAKMPSGLRDLQEIRLRAGKPLLIRCGGEEYMPEKETDMPYIVSKGEIDAVMEYISSYSLYAYAEEMRQGFLTIEGGHRVGLAGQAVVEGGSVRSLKHIASVNIRIAHEIPGCADALFPFIARDRRLCHTLLISPPGCGKTTILRDIVRQVSDGNRHVRGMTVGVIDERSEIAACLRGVPQNRVGIRTDVMDRCPKAEGMIRMIRSMCPEVLAVDEIGDERDVQAVSYAMHCGCRMLATAHGESMEELMEKPVFSQLFQERRFDRYVFLQNRGEIRAVCDAGGREI